MTFIFIRNMALFTSMPTAMTIISGLDQPEKNICESTRYYHRKEMLGHIFIIPNSKSSSFPK